MKKIKVAFQGEQGAFSQEAAFKFFGKKIETLSCQTFQDVFRLVERKKADFGVIPIENSLEGTIGQNYDLLLKTKVKIFAEIILRISHCLIANQGTKFSQITKVFSHPLALGQCREFLEKKKLKAIPYSDTARACKMIKEEKLKDSACIASYRVAKIYQMKILKRKIETNPKNFTRFFIISKKKPPKSKNKKTSIVFTLRNVPGSLFRALAPLAQYKINLTKIESRPIVGKPWQYNFYLDFEGDIKENRVKKAIKEFKKNTLFFKVLGVYLRGKYKKFYD